MRNGETDGLRMVLCLLFTAVMAAGVLYIPSQIVNAAFPEWRFWLIFLWFALFVVLLLVCARPAEALADWVMDRYNHPNR